MDEVALKRNPECLHPGFEADVVVAPGAIDQAVDAPVHGHGFLNGVRAGLLLSLIHIYPASYGGICRSCQGQSPYEDGPGFALSQQPRMPAPVPIPVEEAVGKHALHDMTQIIPGKEKGAAFVAGQELSAGDICRLLQMGKNRVYVQENTPHPEGWVHEDDAARGFARLMPGDGVEVEAAPREGKVNFRATVSYTHLDVYKRQTHCYL